MTKRVDVKRLAEIEEWRAVELLPSSHIAFHWDLTTFEMRTADLIVFYRCVRDWFDKPQSEAEYFVIHLGSNNMVVSYADLVTLCDLLSDAVKQLPRQVVRWVDSSFAISSLDRYFLPASQISFN